jgi:hypothetical protein
LVDSAANRPKSPLPVKEKNADNGKIICEVRFSEAHYRQAKTLCGKTAANLHLQGIFITGKRLLAPAK